MTNEDKFIKLCETSDFVLVDGYLGKYYKKYGVIMFPKYMTCPPDIMVRDCDYYEEDGKKWILPRDCDVGRYRVQFLNEIKN